MDDPFEKRVPGFDLSRDPERTPMRWDASRNAGFTSGDPWLPLGPDIAARNIASFKADARSILSLYRRLMDLRRSEPALREGLQVPLRSRNDILAYKRTHAGEQLLVALNTVHQPRRFDFSGKGTLLLSTYLDDEHSSFAGPVLLRPDEGVVVRLET
jgi:alpha-glucosidase